MVDMGCCTGGYEAVLQLFFHSSSTLYGRTSLPTALVQFAGVGVRDMGEHCSGATYLPRAEGAQHQHVVWGGQGEEGQELLPVRTILHGKLEIPFTSMLEFLCPACTLLFPLMPR